MGAHPDALETDDLLLGLAIVVAWLLAGAAWWAAELERRKEVAASATAPAESPQTEADLPGDPPDLGAASKAETGKRRAPPKSQ